MRHRDRAVAPTQALRGDDPNLVEHRSIAYRPARWLTYSRVYNLIWMGRWLERADNTARVINNFARIAVENGSDMMALQQSLSRAAAIRGIPTEDPSRALELLLKRHEASSIYHSLATARGNATHVGTLELIRALSEAVLTLEDDNVMPQSPLDALLLTNRILERFSAVHKVIDDHLVSPGSLVRRRDLPPLRPAATVIEGRAHLLAANLHPNPVGGFKNLAGWVNLEHQNL